MRSKVQAFISRESLLREGDKVLVACSGGSDSVALLSVLSSLGFDCVAAHMNFSLRDEESDRDEAFVRHLCEKLCIPLEIKKVDAKKYAAEKSLSIEMAARELRYEWFEDLRENLHLQAIAVGHHMDDDIETFFLNLFRGSGPKGLAGIPVKNGYVVRPLLCVSRQEIQDYLERQHLDYVEDSSNFQTDYLRNKIRLQVLPLLEEISPSLRKNIHRSQSLLRAADQDLFECLKPCLQAIKADGNRLSVGKATRSLLYQWLSPYHFNAKEITRIWQQRHEAPGLMYHAPEHELLLDRGEWLLREKTLERSLVNSSPVDLRFEYLDAPFHIEKNPRFAYLDADKLQFPLTLRHPQKGDAFVPFGMRGRKLLSDFLTDLKLSRFEKENTWLLLSGEEIVWVVGRRISANYGLSSSTQRALRIELL